jgi:hypothetical protein
MMSMQETDIDNFLENNGKLSSNAENQSNFPHL